MTNLAESYSEETQEKNNLSRVEWVYRTLKRSILSNEFYPGYQALEPELAKHLGVSRTPVREALIRLENERLIELIPRRGMRVIPLVPSDMREIYQVLTSLEISAIESLAKRGLDSTSDALLERDIEAMSQALNLDDLEAWAEAEERFHQHLVRQSGNTRLASIVGSLRDQCRRARSVTLKLRDKPTHSVAQCRELLNLIRQGNAEAATQKHRENRTRMSTDLVRILEEFKLPHL